MKVVIELSREEVNAFCFHYNLPIPNDPRSPLRKILLAEYAEVRFPYLKSPGGDAGVDTGEKTQ